MGYVIINENWVAADSKIIKKLLPRATHGFDSANSPLDLEIINETASRGDAWIRQRKQPLWTQKSATKTESLPTHKSSPKLLPRVTHGFDSANSPSGLRNHHKKQSHCCSETINKTVFKGDVWIRQRKNPRGLRIINETASTCDAWIRQRKQPLWTHKSSTKIESLPTQKSSPKLLPRTTHGFDSANSP